MASAIADETVIKVLIDIAERLEDNHVDLLYNCLIKYNRPQIMT